MYVPRQEMTVDDASVITSEILTLSFIKFKAHFSPRASMFVDLYSTCIQHMILYSPQQHKHEFNSSCIPPILYRLHADSKEVLLSNPSYVRGADA